MVPFSNLSDISIVGNKKLHRKITSHPEYRLVINTRIEILLLKYFFSNLRNLDVTSRPKYVRNSKTPTGHAKHEKEKRWGKKNIPPKSSLEQKESQCGMF
ncbi:hypothetical protein CEXT_309551 [Caerostris extrusa]|uniref:Uncharacterized protein n=1 Tax=Caerostris extrusa TaxID=172846 RepID=A0AAV4NJC6_CAEEX|nr:hypothetical protein CEXT_309551 [Caerostris extrusa]